MIQAAQMEDLVKHSLRHFLLAGTTKHAGIGTYFEAVPIVGGAQIQIGGLAGLQKPEHKTAFEINKTSSLSHWLLYIKTAGNLTKQKGHK